MATRLSILDTILFGIRRIFEGETELPERPAIRLLGAGVTVTDNPTDNVTDITIPGASGAVLSISCLAPLENTGTAEEPEIAMTGVISDAQHGTRAGGTLHAVATTSVAGFFSATDKTKLDGLPAPADAATIAYVDAEIAAIPVGTTYTAGAGLTEDPAATFKIDAADATITVNANSIEASGNFGSKQVLSDNGFDTVNGATTLNIGNGNAQEIVLGQAAVPVYAEDAFSAAGTITKTGVAIGTTTTEGIVAKNNTAATGGTPVQKGFALVSSGQAYDTDDAVTRVVRGGWYMEPRSGSTVGYYWRLALDAGAGTWSDSGLYYTNSDPALFGSALVGPTFVSASGNGFWLYAYGSVDGTTTSRGGLAYDGADTVRVTATGSGKVGLRTNSTNRLIIDSAGNRTDSLPADSAIRTHWGTAGVNDIYEAADVTTTTDNTTTNVFTVAMADNSTLELEVHCWAYDTSDPTKRHYFAKRGGFCRNGGAPVSDWEEDIYTTKIIGGWGGGITFVLTEGAPTADDVSIQATGLAGTPIKWISQVKYRVRTTSA